jgi:hypothetical protein
MFESEAEEKKQSVVDEINEKSLTDSQGISNPKYFELVMTLKKAQQKLIATYGDFRNY